MGSLSLVVAVVLVAAIVIGVTLIQMAEAFLARQKKNIATTAKSGLDDMFIFVDPTKIFYYNVIALVFVPLVLWLLFDMAIIAIAAAFVITIMPKIVVKYLRKRRLTQFERQLPDALLMISGGMRAGASLTVALESMVKEQKPPLSQEFELMLREQRLGVDFDTALKNMEKRMPLQDFILVVAGMRISREVGGNFAEILETLAETLRRKHQMEGKIDALTAQGRMQGLIMTCLPLFLLLALTKMEPEAMAPMYNTFYGWATLAVVAGMEVIGYFAIQKVVTIDV
ncbi:MAG: type II secretion system F family protein [Betaproteobacteria bacterium]|nr:type II secretion system F family protein [Betaproteobacteria bacterium]